NGSRRKADGSGSANQRGLPRWIALALDRIAASDEEAALIRGAQVHAIVRLTPLVMTASCVNALILLSVLASSHALRVEHGVWALGLVALALNYFRARPFGRPLVMRPASRRAIRRVVLNGAAFGGVWAIVPAAWFDGSPLPVQLIVAC